jgi:hypothetical protein
MLFLIRNYSFRVYFTDLTLYNTALKGHREYARHVHEKILENLDRRSSYGQSGSCNWCVCVYTNYVHLRSIMYLQCVSPFTLSHLQGESGRCNFELHEIMTQQHTQLMLPEEGLMWKPKTRWSYLTDRNCTYLVHIYPLIIQFAMRGT